MSEWRYNEIYSFWIDLSKIKHIQIEFSGDDRAFFSAVAYYSEVEYMVLNITSDKENLLQWVEKFLVDDER